MARLEDIENLFVQRLDLRPRPSQALYRTRTINLGGLFKGMRHDLVAFLHIDVGAC